MSKYDPLTTFLSKQVGDEIKVTFEDIEDADVIGIALPYSAKHHDEWWANESQPGRHPQCRAWLNAGWKVATVHLPAEYVVFRRLKT